jgi:hypothetical protein
VERAAAGRDGRRTLTTTKADNFRRQLDRHVLEIVQEGPTVSAYYLKEPGKGRMMSTLIVFTPEGIALMGDLTPEQNGSVSALGYGRDWFSGHLSPD